MTTLSTKNLYPMVKNEKGESYPQFYHSADKTIWVKRVGKSKAFTNGEVGEYGTAELLDKRLESYQLCTEEDYINQTINQ